MLAWHVAAAPAWVAPAPLGVKPLLSQAVLGKAATSYGSSYIEVELSRMKTMLGSCPDCEAKNVTSPLSSVLTVVGCARAETALLFKQSLGLQAAASERAGASSSARPIAMTRTRRFRSRMTLLTVRT